MPKNVMKLLKPSPHRERNDFDLSHRHVFSANFGELLPATTIECVPGDYIELRASDLLRALPMVTSPFLRAKQHIDVWFTPYNYMWSNFEQFITQKEEPVSSAYKYSSYLPHADLFDLAQTTTSTANSYKDVVNRDARVGSAKLLDLLGYGLINTGGSASDYAKVNLFRIAQYNKIWYDEYRQQYYDDGTRLLPAGYNAAYLFNFDWMSCDTQANANINSDVNYQRILDAMTQMRYRTWKKDLYTGLMPSTQFGAVSSINNNQLSLRFNNLPSPSNVTISVQSASSIDGKSTTLIGSDGTYQGALLVPSSQNMFDVLSLRRSEAIQIWRENALRAGNRISDNLRAHYGDVAQYHDHRSTYLGSVDAPLNIGDIDSHSQTGTGANEQLGDIAGKGLSSLDEKVFKFNCKQFGAIMVIMSILPEAEYQSNGIDRMNQLLESEDFFIPEYQNLGLEAVSSLNFLNTALTSVKNIGYAPRYYGYKTKLDKCFNGFHYGQQFAAWTSPKVDVYSALSQSYSALPISTLYVNPSLYDGNFGVSVANSDQFLCDVYFDVDAVRPMSVVGMPFS